MLALCLFALQALFALSISRSHATAADVSGFSASAYCEPHRDGGSPPADRDHAPCCILCVAGRDAPPIAAPEDEEPAFALPIVSLAPLAFGWAAPAEREPIGWASSWSSRAPPLA
ncbi:hypothetical protein IY145_19585 [Methylosinus sp. H3A]|uniref:DUF2946 family protein n=1 Tax=Methylosinus sp. H3A TaxID=2785786 RepID=UPI0018C33E79|nr:DUF2946 family protein [Methylosinus sp. H3A]MBG0811558.1 hypothetical protein [Methylosinus sp. H3A]